MAKSVDNVEKSVENKRKNIPKKSKHVKICGRYKTWPKNLAGVKHVMNIKTENDCMELSMVGHFVYKTKKHGRKLRPAKYYRSINRYNTYS